MKPIALILALFIGLASCHTRFFEPSESTVQDIEDKQKEIAEFFAGLFGHFHLQYPLQIKDCFNNINAGLYFSLIQEVNQILEDIKERNSLQLHLEFVKLAVLDQTLKGTHACIIMTQDFSDLLTALNITKRDPLEFQMYLYFYYQAHYLDLFEGFKPVVGNLHNNNIAAGDAFGNLLTELVSTIKQEGGSHLAFAAFGNGASISLDIDEPDDSLQCFDKNASRLYLEYTYKLVEAVSEGTIKEVPLNVYKFWEREGKDIISQIPQSVWECEAASNDIQKINQRLGIDVTTEEFGQRVLKYINDNRFSYYAICKSMKQAFEHHNFHHAGSAHAHLLKAIAEDTK